jgi:hypothetical protein
MSEIDITKVASTVASDFVESRYDDFISAVQSVIKSMTNTARTHLKSTYTSYIANLATKYSQSRTFFIRSEPAYLYDFYIPLALKHNNTIYNTPDITTVTRNSKYSIIIATAGSGKSVFMKHLLLNSLLNKWKIPLFIELRHLNEHNGNLEDFLYSQVSDSLRVERDIFNRALKAGLFVLLLDGLDEVKPARRPSVARDLFAMQDKYDELNIILSSRPDSTLGGWPHFKIFKVEPLSLVQAINLVKKLPFDAEIKSTFVADLETTLYNQHSTFASNPLLLSIMLLTYGQSLSIPKKVSVFYNQAYEALFERHDALKGNYKRERRTTLDILDFAKVFSGFCLYSFDQRQFEFSHTESLDLIERAQRLVRIPCNKGDYLSDAKESVGILLDEGLSIVFPHRSFQEYFAARFIAEAPADMQSKLIDKYHSTATVDSLFRLLYEMRPDVIESYYLSPRLHKLFDAIGVKRSISSSSHLKFLKLLFETLEINRLGVGSSIRAQAGHDYTNLITFCVDICPESTEWRQTVDRATDTFFLTKYGPEYSILTAKLSTRDEFTKDVAEKGRWFSKGLLQTCFNIMTAIDTRERERCASLEQILRPKKSRPKSKRRARRT